MQQVKMYLVAIGDVALLIAFSLSDIDPHLRSIGLIIGIVVGLLTAYKLKEDIMIKRSDRKLREIELKEKILNWEERIKKDYE